VPDIRGFVLRCRSCAYCEDGIHCTAMTVAPKGDLKARTSVLWAIADSDVVQSSSGECPMYSRRPIPWWRRMLQGLGSDA